MKSYILEVSELAAKEYLESFAYYEGEQENLGLAFESEVNYVFNHILKNPNLFPRRFKHYREAALQKFPFFIVYETIDNKIIVHSFFHTSRNPKTKFKR